MDDPTIKAHHGTNTSPTGWHSHPPLSLEKHRQHQILAAVWVHGVVSFPALHSTNNTTN